jgi:hypothetical protein
MRKRFTIAVSIIITTILCVNVIGLSQGNKILQLKDEALEQVPSDNRARLVERLESYIRSQIKGDLNNIYDLMPDGCKNGLRKDEWLKEARYKPVGQLQKVILKNAYTGEYDSPEILPGEKWIINGCGVYKVGDESVSYEASYAALLMNGEWYICRSGISIEGKDKNYIRCSE